MSNKMLVPIQANIVPRNSFDSGANEITYSEFVYKYIAPSPWIHKTKVINDAHKDKHDNEIYKEEHHIFYVWLNDVEGECFIVSTMQPSPPSTIISLSQHSPLLLLLLLATLAMLLCNQFYDGSHNYYNENNGSYYSQAIGNRGL